MALLVIGLVVFIGVHSVRIVSDDFRSRTIARLGLNTWKGLYSVAAIAGFVLIVMGYAAARTDPVVLWAPPLWTRHVAALLSVIGFVLIAAAYVPGNRIKAAVGHPMVVGTKSWAFGHLLANGTLADVVLFGTFLLWAAASFRAARQRDRAAGTVYPKRGPSRDIAVVVAGIVLAGVFAIYLHAPLIGVRPF